MRFGFIHHLIAYLVINAGLVVLNLAPVGFDLDRPGVPLWFICPLAGWGVLLVAHGVLVALGIQLRRADAPGPDPTPEEPAPTPVRRAVDPSKAGRAGQLLGECRSRSGGVLAALGARGGVPVDIDDLLRGAIDQGEHISERLAPIYQALLDGDDADQSATRDRLEGALEGIHTALEVLRLEAVVLQEQGSDDLSPLVGPMEQLREAIMTAAEVLAG